MEQPDTGDAAVLRSLELYDEFVGDPTPMIYERFFVKYPEGEEMFAFDKYMESRMMSSVLMLLSDVADHTTPIEYTTHWIADHVAWGVGREMMFDMFDMIRDTIGDGLGDRWTSEMHDGWCALIDRMRPVMDDQIAEAEKVTGRNPSRVARGRHARR